MTTLQPINLVDFTGGLNLRRSDFNLAQNESPSMRNVEVDPRRGFSSRRGWARWNAADIVSPAVDWEPRNGYVHSLSDDSYVVYMANGGNLYAAGVNGVFSDLSITVTASPHLVDIASWGDVAYIACGAGQVSYKRDGVGTAVAVPDVVGNFNDDYTTPVGGFMPTAEHIEAHSGYVFVAHVEDNPDPSNPTTSAPQPNRLRWSHPDEPEDWATNDFLDIKTGGGRITALKSFQDHLLIFKTESVWALYGYDLDSWQLIQVSRSAGTPSPAAVTASESTLFFYSPVGRSGIFAYQGGQQVTHISEKLRTAMDEIENTDDVWLGWVGRRLWCSLPWRPTGQENDQSSAFVFDPEVGSGAWVRHEAALGHIKCILDRSDTESEFPLAAICGCSGAAAMVRLEFQDRAEDRILEDGTSTAFDAEYRTGWIDADFPDRLKSWRRPRFILRDPDFDVVIKIEAFANYSVEIPTRTSTLTLNAGGNAADWDDGWLWDDGTLWATPSTGSRLERTAPFGHSRALQLQFSVTPATLGAAWGVDAIILKFVYRRFTT